MTSRTSDNSRHPGWGEALRTDSGSDPPRLTPAEDSELRQPAWFAEADKLSEKAQARLSELRARDRRANIRDPRPGPTGYHVGHAPRLGAHAPEPTPVGAPAYSDAEARPLGTVDSDAFRDLLLGAANGALEAADNERATHRPVGTT